jgi:hypothetical protein
MEVGDHELSPHLALIYLLVQARAHAYAHEIHSSSST